jgi:uncharacterized protein
MQDKEEVRDEEKESLMQSRQDDVAGGINDGNNNGNGGDNAANSPQPQGHLNGLTVMTGVSAGLLSACLSHDLPCTAVLIPTAKGVPDPEGAAMLIRAISAMPNVPPELDVNPLIQQGKEIKRRLEATIASIQQQNGEGQLPSAVSARRSMIHG